MVLIVTTAARSNYRNVFMKMYSSYTIILLLMFLTSCSLQKTTVQYKQAEGVKANKLSLDIYNTAEGGNKPVVVFVHGGGWLLGDKSTKIRHKVALFESLGYVFVSVNYRLSSLFHKKTQYPAHTNDVADAIKWIYENISRYGGNREQMVLMGHSAGAQMISLLATSDEFLPPRNISPNHFKGIISLDTEGYDVHEMGRAGASIYQRIFSNNPETWKEASPVLQVRPGKSYPDFLIVMRGKTYRIEMAQTFAEKLKSSGAAVELVNAESYGHFKVNNILGNKKDRIVTPRVVEFLKRAFRQPSFNAATAAPF